jgi:hypothetical protein
MFANDAKSWSKVWVRIGQGESAPLVPGIVTDARVGDRPLLRSAAKGGPLNVLNSVIVISLRENVTPDNGRPALYTVERPEALIALSPRATAIPAIDGTDKMTKQQVLVALRAQVTASLAALNPTPDTSKVEAEAARYLNLPGLLPA